MSDKKKKSKRDLLLKSLEYPKNKLMPPLVITMMGLPGSGKTFCARFLKRHLPLIYVSSDELRQV